MKKQTTSEDWQKIDAIFQQVVDLPAAEQAETISRLAAGNERLSDEVKSLLEFDETESSDQIAALRSSGSASGNNPPGNPSVKAGDLIGEFRLLFPVSISSASEVWCAEAVDSSAIPNQHVAIKLLRTKVEAGSKDRHVLRFVNEARLMSRFRHPSIASFIQAGQTESGFPYIVMNYVDGKSITRYSDDQRLTIAERIELVIQVCQAVAYAHRFLVVHRDLKPENILVTADGNPVVLDFGISKQLDSNSQFNNENRSLIVTSADERPMTPAYASPEQLQGDEITTSTDVHALGLILYELLCGHHPFSSACHNGEATFFDRAARLVPIPPSEAVSFAAQPLEDAGQPANDAQMIAALRRASTSQLKRQLKPGPDAVVLKAIARNPDQRYGSVDELRNDLVRALEGRPVKAARQSASVAQMIRKRPLVAIVSASIATAAMVLVGAFLFWSGRIAGLKQRADQAIDRMDERNSALEQVTQELEESRARFADFESVVATALGQNVEDLSSGRLTISAPMKAALARQAAREGRWPAARELIAQLDEATGMTSSAEDLDINSRLALAEALQILGRPGQAMRLLDDVPVSEDPVEWFKQNCDDPVAAETLLVRLLLDTNRLSQANDVCVRSTLIDDVAGHESAIDLLLAAAEARFKIAWQDGAITVVDHLNPQETGRLTDAQQLRLNCIKARIDGRSLIPVLKKIPDAPATATAVVAIEYLHEQASRAIEDNQIEAARECVNLSKTWLEMLPIEDHYLHAANEHRKIMLLEATGDEDSADRLREQLWQTVKQTQAFGTEEGIWTGITLMIRNEDSRLRSEILSALADFRPAIVADPYRERWIERFDYETAAEREEWASAVMHVQQLMELESRLWGRVSFPAAYARAALAHALVKVGRRTEAGVVYAETKAVVEELAEDNPSVPSVAYLNTAIAISESEHSHPVHPWIQRFTMHSSNPETDQLEMLRYYVIESEIAAGIRRLLFVESLAYVDLIRTEATTANEGSMIQDEYAIRLCRVANELGEFSRASTFLLLRKSDSNPDVADRAAACLIQLHVDRDEVDEGHEIAREFALGPHTREVISETIDRLGDRPEERGRWQELLN
ncbi:MAG: serine/threonine-protein kinase [Planctomycetota bacterium]